MSDLTLKEVLLADMYEKEIEQMKEKKQKFIEWLENFYNTDPDIDEYVEMFIGKILDKAKEML